VWALVAGLVALSLVLGAVLARQQAELRDRREALDATIAERDEALQTIAGLEADVARLEERLATTSAGTTEIEQQLADARARLEAFLGPTLPDGRHFGKLYAVGVDQEPPRLVIDIQAFLTDQEAIDAAIEDGVIKPGEIVENGYYIRNQNPRWRVIEIDSSAQVTLTTYPYADPSAPKVISLERFGELYNSDAGTLQYSPYWIEVRDGIVVAIEEQFLP
jgi:hypothetical protein